jgi:hypothetical protein
MKEKGYKSYNVADHKKIYKHLKRRRWIEGEKKILSKIIADE